MMQDKYTTSVSAQKYLCNYVNYRIYILLRKTILVHEGVFFQSLFKGGQIIPYFSYKDIYLENILKYALLNYLEGEWEVQLC